MRNAKRVSIAALVATSALLAGCTVGDSTNWNHSRYVLLTSGTYKGAGWQLFAWQQQGDLCMEVDPAGFDPDHYPSASEGLSAGACKFDDSPTAGYYTTGPGPEGSMVSFGPLPTSAVQIRVAPDETLATMPMPHGQGLPAGRYWINVTDTGGPATTEGGFPTLVPLDAQGQPVPFQDF